MTIAPNMYYIQRLVICSSQPKGEKDTTLLISGDYMGSAEFEFGSVTNSWQFLTTINPRELFTIDVVDAETGNSKPVYAITTEQGRKRFRDNICKHVSLTRRDREMTKEWTGIADRFHDNKTNRPDVNAWIDVTGFVSRYIRSGEPLVPDEDTDPVFFTFDKDVAQMVLLRIIMKVIAVKHDEKAFDLRFGMQVLTPLEPTMFGTISGIYDDNTVVIKYKHRKTLRVPYDYVLPESLYNEYIKEGMNTSV